MHFVKMSLEDWNHVLQLLITGKDILIFLWLAYWSQRFWRSYRRGENGVAKAMALFFTAMSVDRLWLVMCSLYKIFFLEMEVITLAFLGWREMSAWFVIASMVLIMWRFSRDTDTEHNKQHPEAGSQHGHRA